MNDNIIAEIVFDQHRVMSGPLPVKIHAAAVLKTNIRLLTMVIIICSVMTVASVPQMMMTTLQLKPATKRKKKSEAERKN